jgi:hypothetical protein
VKAYKKKKKKKKKLVGTKEARKQANKGDEKLENKGEKTQMVGKEKENKNIGFHQMATKFVHTS